MSHKVGDILLSSNADQKRYKVLVGIITKRFDEYNWVVEWMDGTKFVMNEQAISLRKAYVKRMYKNERGT